MTNRRLDPGDVEELVWRRADICNAVGEEDESVTRSKRGIALAHGRHAREPERRPGDRQWFELAIRPNDERWRMPCVRIDHPSLGHVDDPIERRHEIPGRHGALEQFADPGERGTQPQLHADEGVKHRPMGDGKQRRRQPFPFASAIEMPNCESGYAMKSNASPPTDSAVSDRPTSCTPGNAGATSGVRPWRMSRAISISWSMRDCRINCSCRSARSMTTVAC